MWKKGIPLSATGETYVRWYHKWESGFIFNLQADQKLVTIYDLNPPDEWGQTSDWRTYVHLIGTDKGSQPSELSSIIWSGTGRVSGTATARPAPERRHAVSAAHRRVAMHRSDDPAEYRG